MPTQSRSSSADSMEKRATEGIGGEGGASYRGEGCTRTLRITIPRAGTGGGGGNRGERYGSPYEASEHEWAPRKRDGISSVPAERAIHDGNPLPSFSTRRSGHRIRLSHPYRGGGFSRHPQETSLPRSKHANQEKLALSAYAADLRRHWPLPSPSIAADASRTPDPAARFDVDILTSQMDPLCKRRRKLFGKHGRVGDIFMKNAPRRN